MVELDTILFLPAKGSTLLADPCAPTVLWDTRRKLLAYLAESGRGATVVDTLVLARNGTVQRHGVLVLAGDMHDRGMCSVSFGMDTMLGAVTDYLGDHRQRLPAFIEANWPEAKLVFVCDGRGV